MDRSACLDAANQLMVASEETDDFVLALGLAEGTAYLLNQATAMEPWPDQVGEPAWIVGVTALSGAIQVAFRIGDRGFHREYPLTMSDFLNGEKAPLRDLIEVAFGRSFTVDEAYGVDLAGLIGRSVPA